MNRFPVDTILRISLAGWCVALGPHSLLGQTVGTHKVTRAVRVTANRGSLMLAPLVVKSFIDLNGNNILVDSYDSSNPAFSTNGQYDPAKAGDKGDVYSDLGVVNSIKVGNANIYGHAHTGPGGSVTSGPNGGVGEHAWQALNPGTVEPGWFTDDSNFTFPTFQLPYATGLKPTSGNVVTPITSTTSNTVTYSTFPSPPPPGGVTTNVTSYTTVSTYPVPTPAGLTTNQTMVSSSTYPIPTPANLTTNLILKGKNGTTYVYRYPVPSYTYPNFSYSSSTYSTNVTYATNFYDNILNTGDYVASSLSGKTIVLGQARLVLPNGLTMSSSDSFTVLQSASVAVFCDGTSVSLGGAGVNNQSGLAGNLVFECTPNVTQFKLSAGGSFLGVLIAPNAQVFLTGGASVSSVNYCGSIMAESVKMNGHFKFHYDDALSKIRYGRYLVTSWNEIPVAQ
jgi:hypothetical protein